MAAKKNDRTTAGPATYLDRAPGSTYTPTPMVAPTPSAVRSVVVSTLFSMDVSRTTPATVFFLLSLPATILQPRVARTETERGPVLLRAQRSEPKRDTRAIPICGWRNGCISVCRNRNFREASRKPKLSPGKKTGRYTDTRFQSLDVVHGCRYDLVRDRICTWRDEIAGLTDCGKLAARQSRAPRHRRREYCYNVIIVQ